MKEKGEGGEVPNISFSAFANISSDVQERVTSEITYYVTHRRVCTKSCNNNLRISSNFKSHSCQMEL